MSQKSDSSSLMPRDILPDHVIGFIEALHSLGGQADPMHIGDIVEESIELLPKVIDMAELLGFVKYENGYLRITNAGKMIAEANPKKLRTLLREIVLKNRIEPLHEIYEALKRRKSIPIDEFIQIVEKHYKRINNDIIRNVLIWGTYLRLFKLSEDDTQVILIS